MVNLELLLFSVFAARLTASLTYQRAMSKGIHGWNLVVSLLTHPSSL